ncbi:energy-converting hydrogenase B subunit J [Methanobrevibacter sp.]|uniref:energy-converting hydrogenase B subunit J n=1 Tax=Methanobrevibacter sp. TaxID=66852 RepID=UPI002E797634|nr:energy-converting hydrogenase B subunit J [Methanobrevibacter sp.]MEE1337067.1 energy-converting hydrogenase B subunit J [Methanobrevibacter sp.]
MMIIIGPIIIALILGLIIGSQIKLNNGDTHFTLGSFIVILIAGIVVAWQSGNYPFYTDLPISTAFLSALIGIFVGKLIFARSK